MYACSPRLASKIRGSPSMRRRDGGSLRLGGRAHDMTPLDAFLTPWPKLNEQLDEALALPKAERTAWREALSGDRGELKDRLHELLAAHGRAGAEDAFGTMPPLPGDEAGGEPAAVANVGPYLLFSELGRGAFPGTPLAKCRH
jgi:hypothetical protein